MQDEHVFLNHEDAANRRAAVVDLRSLKEIQIIESKIGEHSCSLVLKLMLNKLLLLLWETKECWFAGNELSSNLLNGAFCCDRLLVEKSSFRMDSEFNVAQELICSPVAEKVCKFEKTWFYFAFCFRERRCLKVHSLLSRWPESDGVIFIFQWPVGW